MASPFLTARWENLALITYAVDESKLKEVMPPGCVADTRDGSAFVSLVAFDFVDTRVGGIRWPGFVSFPEINLRAYVRHRETRGVVFVKELVPQALVAWAARALYNEPYAAATMESRVEHDARAIRVHHRFELGGVAHEIEVVGAPTPRLPPPDSTEHFFKEHDHGFGTDRRGRRIEYRVHHPHWRVYDVQEHRVNVDYAAAYGRQWAFLGESTPVSVVLAEGSGVAVHPGVVTSDD